MAEVISVQYLMYVKIHPLSLHVQYIKAHLSPKLVLFMIS